MEGTNTGATLLDNAATRSLKRLDAGSGISLDTATDPRRVIVSSTVTSLAQLTGATADTSRLALGLGAGTPAASDVLVGPAACGAGPSAGSNTAVGTNALRFGQGASNVAVGADAMNAAVAGTGASNVAVGSGAGAGVRNGNQNVALGAQAGPALSATPADGSGNVTVGYRAGRALTGAGAQNVCVGNQAALALTTGTGNTAVGNGAGIALTTGAGNLLVGAQAGNAITTGSNNVVLGAFAGAAALTNSVVLADGAGTVRMRWDNANNAVQTLDATAPSLTADNTMAFAYNSAQQGLNVSMRSGGVPRPSDSPVSAACHGRTCWSSPTNA